MADGERAQIEAAVMALAEQWHDAVQNHDAEAMVALFDRATAHATDGAAYYPDWDSVLAHNRELFASWASTDTEWVNTRIDVLSSDAAFFVGQSEGVQRFTNGNEYHLRGYFSFLVRKIDGVWKLVYQQSTGGRTRIEPPAGG
jgi:ketosteroid isomerase-like protein